MKHAVVVAAAVAALSPAHGKQLYGQYCISCHGANGQGVTHGRTIGGGPQRAPQQQTGVGPSLRGVGALAADFYLRTGYMPLHRVGDQPRRARVLFDDAQIKALVAYVASLGKGPAVPTPHPERGSLSEGLHLFTDHCAGCHQVVAQGGVVSATSTGSSIPTTAAAGRSATSARCPRVSSRGSWRPLSSLRSASS